MLETHISWVLLTGPYAYKLKKPVDLGFVDFSTLELREKYCHEEIRLNRRLAPDLYREVIPITGSEDKPEFNGNGEIIDFAVQMMQFPQDRLLSDAIKENRLTADHINQLAEEVAEFHAKIAIAGADLEWGTPEKVFAPVEENFRHVNELFSTEDTVQKLLDLIRAENEHCFQKYYPLFQERKVRGYIRECHGDMHLGNMILSERGVTLFDCLEFNAGLRWVDVLSEVAFVVMDLEDRGRADFAMQFLNRYLELTGDYAGIPLLRFYLSYRAMVRAKVAAIRLSQPELSDLVAKEVREEFQSYLELAKDYVMNPKPRLLLTHGVSGSGKSYGSELLLEGMSAIRIRSDIERKRLQNERQIPDSDLYSAETTRLVYERLVALAQLILESGWNVIVDATSLKFWQRILFYDLSEKLEIPFQLVVFSASRAQLESRIRQREKNGNDPSDATTEVLQLQLDELDPLGENELKQSVAIPVDQEWTTEFLVQLLQDAGDHSQP
ncbi:bifunctional aminoglycoside phosphotransferase/ATP-binding protein [Gimesia algae]|nr:bifunctional aminoglycoside phosphotransferase/ATP-binding protein [Gimesia algae]